MPGASFQKDIATDQPATPSELPPLSPAAYLRPDLPPLPSGIEDRLESPIEFAVLLGSTRTAELVSAVTRLGLEPVWLAGDGVVEEAADLGPFPLVLVGPDTLGEDFGELMNGLRRLSPTMVAILAATPQQLSATQAIGAMRAGVIDVVDPSSDLALRSLLGGHLARVRAVQERVLAIGAHPDDVEIGCAGTLLQHRRYGDDLTVLTLSHGGVGGATEARVEESVDAAARIGGRLLLADLPDTKVDAGVETIRMIEAVVSAVDPTVIYVHSRHDNHQDHRAVNTAVLSASRGVPRVLAYQSPSATNDFRPSTFVAIDDVVEVKVDVLQMFASQGHRSYLEPDMVRAGARYWARHLAPRTRYAEPFEVVRALHRDARGIDSGPAADRSGRAEAPMARVIDLADRKELL